MSNPKHETLPELVESNLLAAARLLEGYGPFDDLRWLTYREQIQEALKMTAGVIRRAAPLVRQIAPIWRLTAIDVVPSSN